MGVSSADVEEIIFSLRNKPGNINTFSTSALKRVRRQVSHVLCHIINLSLRTGIFPDCLKLARVSPIPKLAVIQLMLATTDQYRYYRSLVKYLKKVLYEQLYTYCEQNNILYDHQYGFRKHMSTMQSLLNHMQFMYDSIDSGNFVISVFLYFKKALDTVNHNILLSKFDFFI